MMWQHLAMVGYNVVLLLVISFLNGRADYALYTSGLRVGALLNAMHRYTTALVIGNVTYLGLLSYIATNGG